MKYCCNKEQDLAEFVENRTHPEVRNCNVLLKNKVFTGDLLETGQGEEM